MKGNTHTLVFAAALGIVCAALLTAVGELTRDRRDTNEEAQRKRNILSVLDPEYDSKVPAEQVLADFKRKIPRGKEPWGDLQVYRYEVDGELQAMAVPFAGDGLWDKIEGYLALEKDFTTIRGIAITEEHETPGLGAEIKSPRVFRNQWVGKRIETAAGILIKKTRDAKANNEVDGIAGATETCTAVQDMVNEIVTKIVKMRDKKEAGHGE